MNVFFSDLDNTLIYSHNWEMNCPKIAAEHYKGREQSFMTEQTYKFLLNMGEFQLVPVTARTLAQYDRIFILRKLVSRGTALICNGGVLLFEGLPDKEWYNDTMKLAENELPCVERAYNKLSDNIAKEHIHFPEPFMVYGVCENPEKISEILKNDSNITVGADINFDSRKVYVTAKSVTKGNAVMRYCKRFGVDFSVSAGDSEFDIPMLNISDIAICSDYIADKVTAPEIYNVGTGIISDKIINIIKILNKKF